MSSLSNDSQPSNQDESKQTNQQRLLELLIDQLFVLVCSYLSLDEKCRSLLHLSKTIKQTINQSTEHFFHDYVSIHILRNRTNPVQGNPHIGNQLYSYLNPANNQHDNQSLAVYSTLRAGRLPYLQYARRIKIKIEHGALAPVRRKNVLLSLKKAIKSGALRTLTINEECFSQPAPGQVKQPSTQPSVEQSLTCDVLALLNGPSIRLTQLHLYLNDSLSQRPVQFWGGLKQCNTLKQLIVDIGEGNPSQRPNDLAKNEIALVDNLPNSIEDLIIHSYLTANDRLAFWKPKMRKDFFLPMLKRLALKDYKQPIKRSMCLRLFGSSLTSTVMKSTGKVRPITSWVTDTLEQLDELARLPLIDLTCLQITPEAEAQLARAPDDLFPHLKKITMLYGGRGTSDMSSLVTFASHRPIEEFILLGDRSNSPSLISDAIVKTIGEIKTLTFLNLRSERLPLFLSRDLSALVSPLAWPKLRQLELNCAFLTEEQLRALLMAVPAAENVAVCSKLPSPLVLAMILNYCPIVGRVLVLAQDDQTSITMATIRDAFTRYPIRKENVQRLLGLLMPFHGSDRLLHYVLRQLTCAPRLSVISIADSYPETVVEPSALYITRMLPHVQCILQLMHESVPGVLHPMITRLKSPDLNNTIDFRIVPGGSRYDITFHSQFYIPENQPFIAETVEEAIVASFGIDFPYVTFKRQDPQTGQPGRDRFYEVLYGMLTADQKKLLVEWDAGDY